MANRLIMEDTGSSNPVMAGYDEETRIMVADFKGNARYVYPDFDPENWRLWRGYFGKEYQGESAGTYFARYFRDKPCVRID